MTPIIPYSIPSESSSSPDVNAPTVAPQPPAVGATNSPDVQATRRVDDLGSVQDALKMSTDGQPCAGLGTASVQRDTVLESETAGETAGSEVITGTALCSNWPGVQRALGDSVTGGESAATNSVSDGGLAAPRETEMEPSATPALSLSEDAPLAGSQTAVAASPLSPQVVAAAVTNFESALAPAMAADTAAAPDLTDPPVAVAVAISTPSGAFDDVASVTAAGAASCGLAAFSSVDPELEALVSACESEWPAIPSFLRRSADNVPPFAKNASTLRVAAVNEIAPIFSASINDVSKSISAGA